MIAPISLENNSITGAGSVITKNVEENDIIIARAEQKVLKGKAIEYRNRRKK
jgi:bifunctional UDP-N-acetylglucosamine pyrophosphorylase/glucosamine-1-phosphate N-acetyltransferase